MNNCVYFLHGVIANSYTTQTGAYTTITTTLTRATISITMHQTDSFNFIDHTWTNKRIQIPSNALYSGTYIATAINNLTL